MYGSEICVVMDRMLMVLEGFHHRIARRIARMTVQRGNVREWEWSLVDAALEVTELWTLMEYSRRRKVTLCGVRYREVNIRAVYRRG